MDDLRLFSHTSDFSAGYRQLPSTVFIAPTVSVWAPTRHDIAVAHSQGSPINPRGFLELVERGAVQVMARDWWYEDKKRRNETRREARWNWRFDNALRRFAREDENHDPAARRVLIAKPEIGWNWADEQLETPGSVAVAEARSRLFTPHPRLPQGVREKAEREAQSALARGKPEAEAQRRALRTVLRDARNHEDAFEDSEAQLPVGPDDHADAIPAIAGSEPLSGRAEDLKLDPVRLQETLWLIQSIRREAHPRWWDRRRYSKLLRRDDVAELRSEIGWLLAQRGPLLAALRTQIRAEIDVPRASLSRLIGGAMADGAHRAFKSDSWQCTALLASAVIGLADSPASGVLTRLSLSALAKADLALSGLSALPPARYEGATWAYLLAFGQEDPFRFYKEELERDLMDLKPFGA